MNFTVNKNLFLKATVFLIFLRSPMVLLAIATYLLTSKKALVVFLSRIVPFVVLMLICVFYAFAMGNGQAEVVGQSRDIFLALTVAFFLITASKDMRNNRVCYNSIKVCFIIVAILKVILLAYSIVSGTNLVTLIEAITKVWDIQMMTLGTDDSAVGRIQIPIDSAVPYFLYFYTKEIFESKRTKIGLVLFALLCFSMLLTYSRLMWAQSILFIAISIIVEMKLKAKIKLFFSAFIIGAVVMYLTPLGDTISNIIDARFGSASDKTNQASDIVRQMQNTALWVQVKSSPLFGHGLGYYIPTFIRSTDTRYLYESQSLSMLMTLGYVGVVVWVVMLMGMLIFVENKRTIPLGSLFFLFFWGLCGSYNPYLFGASGGLILYFSSQFKKINEMVMEQPATARPKITVNQNVTAD